MNGIRAIWRHINTMPMESGIVQFAGIEAQSLRGPLEPPMLAAQPITPIKAEPRLSPSNNLLDPAAKYAASSILGHGHGKNQQERREVKPRILIARPKEKPLNRNDKIRLSLERAYPTGYKDILDQAYAAFYYSNPASSNLPELYELLESGFIDQGLEACGLGQWAIGRPK